MYPNHNYKKITDQISQSIFMASNEDVLINIKQRIETNRPTIRQFNSVIKFIEKEKEFINSDRSEIQQFFNH